MTEQKAKPGRPFVDPQKRVSECVNSRLTWKEASMLEGLAEYRGETVSKLVRRIVVGCLVKDKLCSEALESFDAWSADRL